ncbi:secondary thiamine-phosphate synthase enzyme YjbQ [Stappia indica]|nr:secondary thiamine-phosphate synthase enzyme YjbQ [Stappia indica]MCA1297961.1 secondary thiamine-phosphate synthase enzyme YjbQ [Stappia indica]
MMQRRRGEPVETWTFEDDGLTLRQRMGRLVARTQGRGFYPVGRWLDDWLAEQGARDGELTVFLRHTSASLTVQENADPDVQDDLLDALDRLAPEDAGWRHSMEGPDDMPAHVKTVLTGVSLQIPVVAGRLDLGTWQDVYVIEHRTEPHQRSMTLRYLGT